MPLIRDTKEYEKNVIIKMCLGKIHIPSVLSYKGLKQGDASSPLPFNVALEYAI
jgi:hypothetical protein